MLKCLIVSSFKQQDTNFSLKQHQIFSQKTISTCKNRFKIVTPLFMKFEHNHPKISYFDVLEYLHKKTH